LVFIAFFTIGYNQIAAAPAQPNLPVATEVQYTAATTATVSNASDFVTNYQNNSITRIVLLNDITLTKVQTNDIKAMNLIRSLQIDGGGNKLTLDLSYTTQGDEGIFSMTSLTAFKTTFHLKDIAIISQGNIIDGNGTKSKNWTIILEDTLFPKAIVSQQAMRIVRGNCAHIFLRGNVTMHSSAENLMVGRLTVERNANVYSESNSGNVAIWSFDGTVGYSYVKRSLDIGENAKVELRGTNGATHGAVAYNWENIDIHKNAELIIKKPGSAFKYMYTLNMPHKYINVFDGATLSAESIGIGDQPLICMSNTADENCNDSGSKYVGHFYAGANSKVFLIGSNSSSTIPLVSMALNNSTFDLDHPAQYNIRNNYRDSSSKYVGYAFNIGPGGNFYIREADVEVWERNRTSLDTKADKSWYHATLVTSALGGPLLGTEGVTFDWKTSKYARISGYDTRPVLELGEITDADLIIGVQAYVNDLPAEANQVNVTISDNKSSVKSTGWTDANGKYRYIKSNFYKAGTEVTATGYRNVEFWSTRDPQAKVIVKDVTPPTPAIVQNTISSSAKKITGFSDEPGAMVTLTLNGNQMKNATADIVSTTVQANGQWEIIVPSNISLTPGDNIQVFLTDTENNANPEKDTYYKDAIFKAASKIIVVADPQIIADDYYEIELNSTYSATTGVSGLDSSNNTINFGTGEYDLKYDTNVDTSKIGIYKTTYTMKDRLDTSVITTKEVVVIVKDNNVMIDYENSYMIYAKSYQLNKDIDVVYGNYAEIYSNSAAKAWSINDGSQVEVSIIDSSNYQNEIGGYPITIGIKDHEEISKQIVASIIGNTTELSDNYAIDASDFIIAKKDISGESDVFASEYGNAKAWHLSDNSKNATIDIIGNDGYAKGVNQGIYALYLSLEEDGSFYKEIEAKVIDREEIGVSSNYIIGANSITIGKKVAESINNEEDFIALNNVKGWQKDDLSKEVNVSLTDTDFIPVPGEYVAIYRITDEPTTIVEVTITVEDRDYAYQGTEYIIKANDFSINSTIAANISEDEIVNKSAALAYLLSDKTSSGKVKVGLNEIEASEGIYNVELYVEEEELCKVIIKVNVADGLPPTLEVTNPIEISLGDSFDNKVGVSVSDDVDELSEDDVTVDGLYNIDEAGIYVLTYSVTDSDYNKVSKTRVLVVNDGSYEVGSNYILKAEDFIIKKKDVVSSGEGIIASAHAQAYKISDGTSAELVISDKGNYTNELGMYNITIAAKDELTTTKTIQATVIDKDEVSVGNEYSIGANNITIGKKDVNNLNNDKFIALTQAESWKKNDYEIKSSVVVEDLTNIQASVGTYYVTMHVGDEADTKVTIKVTVIDKDYVVEVSSYAISANDVTISKIKAQTVSGVNDFITLTDAKGWNKETNEEASVMVANSAFAPMPGSYKVTLALTDSTNTRLTVTITVLDKENVNSGTIYAIGANDFTINTTQAANIDEAGIISKAAAKSYLKDTVRSRGTVKVSENTIKNIEGTYNVELYVAEEATTKVIIKVNVTNGQAPKLTVTNPITINVKESFDEKVGVSISDDKDSLTVADVVITGQYDENVAGVYVLTYSVIDSDYNEVTKTRVLVVNDGSYEVGSKYIVKATDFIINKKDVDTSSNAIISAAQAKGYHVSDGTSAELVVNNKGNYTNTVGNYNIIIAAKDELTTTKTIQATVIAKDEVSVGNEYSIGANHIVIGIEDAKSIDNDQLITLTQAEVWLNEDYTTKGHVEVEDISNVLAQVGTYQVSMHAQEEVQTKTTINVEVINKDKVVEGSLYSIGANNVIIGKQQAQTILTNEDLISLNGVSAWQKDDLSTSVAVEVQASDFVAAPGNYQVTYQVKDEVSTKVSVSIKVIDNDQVKTGSNYVIGANDFSLNTTQAANIDEAGIISNALATSYLIDTLQESGTIKVGTNGIKATEGIYNVELYVAEEAT
ncbi:DUF5011 domain-containing protein, partial [Erysipelotrichaceae bacterium OttesenSCG-928-M19]|nr:DUF5011 domain-containing protein [Erysipelotrichaceae bacterium OttesenSCG-928-M19]